MKKDKRLFERLIRTLDLIPVSPRKISAPALHKILLADGFDVTKRTVERDLIQLSQGFGIFNDDAISPQGWSWHKDTARLSLPSLNAEESLTFKMVEFYLSKLMPMSLLDKLQPYFLQANKVLQNPFMYQAYKGWLNKVVVVHPWQPLIPPEFSLDVLANVQHALWQEKILEIAYCAKHAETAQIYWIKPLGLVVRGFVTYVVCNISPYEDIRLLALNRINSALVTDQTFVTKQPFNLKNYVASGALGYAQGEKISVKLRFKREAGAHLMESKLSVDQVIEDEATHLIVKADVIDNPQLTWWILGFGASVEVLAPEQLRNRIKQEVDKLHQIYQ